MNKDLSDTNVKLKVLEMNSQGIGAVEISKQFGIHHSNISRFLNRLSHRDWWAEYSEKMDTKPSRSFKKEVDEVTPIRIVTSKYTREFPTHLMIPDTQVKPGIDMSYLSWIGKYIAHRKPDVIVHIGDHFDLPSLSSYDKGTKKAEGRRLQEDIVAGKAGMNLLLEPLAKLQKEELDKFGIIKYKPKMIFTIGNHERRQERHIDANPELHGLVGYDSFCLDENGWEVYDFLEPARVDGITYIHYMPNPMTGKPYGGSALNILQKTGESFSMGHCQKLDLAPRTLPTSGRKQWGLICGASYPHDEEYKGYTGNKHFRGVIVKHQVNHGDYDPMIVSLDYLKSKFNGK